MVGPAVLAATRVRCHQHLEALTDGHGDGLARNSQSHFICPLPRSHLPGTLSISPAILCSCSHASLLLGGCPSHGHALALLPHPRALQNPHGSPDGGRFSIPIPYLHAEQVPGMGLCGFAGWVLPKRCCSRVLGTKQEHTVHTVLMPSMSHVVASYSRCPRRAGQGVGGFGIVVNVAAPKRAARDQLI